MTEEGRDQTNGRFLPGNRLWEARSSAGPKPKFEKAEDLWAACCEYFEWVSSNPLWEDKLVTFQGSATHEPVAKMRPMTLIGLCYFLDISRDTWCEWRVSRSDLSDVINRAEAVIYEQKFSGAAADLMNANIISRELGLADRTEVSGKDGGPIQTDNVNTNVPVTDHQRAKALAALLARNRAAQQAGGGEGQE